MSRAAPPLRWFCCLALLLGGCAPPPGEAAQLGAEPPVAVISESSPQSTSPGPERRIRCPSFDRELFASGISGARAYTMEEPPRAGVVPHHLIASDMIAGFFALAARSPGEYDTVLLVSPSHFPENCGSDVVTASLHWDTPVGGMRTDRELTASLLAREGIGAEDNPAALEADHGVTGLVPFARHYLPESEIATVLLANRLSRERLELFWDWVAEACREKRVLLVSSMDCSHYLSPGEALLRDEETARAIEGFDLEQILTFTDRNVDSPQALTTFLSRALDGELALRRLDHDSSGRILPHAASSPAYHEGVTTYFVYAAGDSISADN